MKSTFVLAALGVLALTVPAVAETPTAPQEKKPKPAVVLPQGELPTGRATNLVFLAPALGGLLGLAALAGGGGTSSTGATTSTN